MFEEWFEGLELVLEKHYLVIFLMEMLLLKTA